jgi:leader peptidase (prepilin peptidase) / N-methyltransferase
MGMAAVATLALGVAGMVMGVFARRLLGRLRRGARVRAPVCELAVGALWALTGGLWGAGDLTPNWLPVLLGLSWLGIAAGLVDLRHHRLPDALTLPAACVAPLAVLPLGTSAVGRGLLGSAMAVACYGSVHLASPSALGAGDVKLAASLGTVLGGVSWSALAVASGLAALGTAAAALVAAGIGGLSRRGTVPHGPSMLAASWVMTALAAVGASAVPP